MTMQLGSQPISPNTPGFFNAPQTGMKGLIIGNESPYTLSIVVGTSITKTLYPETVDFFPTGAGFNGNVTYIPSTVLTNPLSYTAASIFFDAVGPLENIDVSVYPMALTRPAVNPTASGDPLFSLTALFGATGTAQQVMNVFNPPNSNTIMTFHSSRIYSTDTGLPEATLFFITGADLNLGTTLPAVCHTVSVNPPNSVSHCSGVDATFVLPAFNQQIDLLTIQASVTQDMLTFPDNVVLYPGNNLVLSIVGSASGKTVRLIMKWSEKALSAPFVIPVIPPPPPPPPPMQQPYGVTMGINSSASTLIDQAASHGTAVADMQSLGLSWLRLQVPWHLVDNTGTINQNTATYTWACWDDAITQCNAANINVSITIHGAPNQFQGPSGNPLNPGYTATFASQIASRYNGVTIITGGGTGTVQAIEIGNEDYNLSADVVTSPVPIVQQLSTTLIACYPAIKTANSSVIVVAAAKLNRNGKGYTAWFDTLLNPTTGAYKNGVFQSDALNFQYYTGIPTSGVCSLNNAYNTPTNLDPTKSITTGNGIPSITNNGDGECAWLLLNNKVTQYSVSLSQGIWMTETGFAINQNNHPNPCEAVSQAVQSNYLIDVVDACKTSKVATKFFFFTLSYYDGFGVGTNARDGMSLVQGLHTAPTYNTAFNTIKSYISNHPTW